MQTFLPFRSFSRTAECLDYRRLGKQRVEAWQILQALTGSRSGWINHPAVKMWRGYEGALSQYGGEICLEWRRRGYRDSLLEKFQAFSAPIIYPSWLGDPDFHWSHRSNLLRKDKAHYSKWFPGVPDDLPYVWPE